MTDQRINRPVVPQRRGPACARRPPARRPAPSAARSCMHLLQFNAEGISSKMPELCKLLQDRRVDVACVQETHASEGRDPRVAGYSCVWRHRSSGRRSGGATRGGGVAILIREGLRYEVLQTRPCASDDITTEWAGVRVFPFDKAKEALDIHCVYVPPIRHAECDERQQRFSSDHLPSIGSTLILGDFNAHHPAWDPESEESDQGSAVYEWSTASGMRILNDGSPTHMPRRVDARQTAPDVSLCHRSLAGRAEWLVLEDAGSDHLPILITIRGKRPGKGWAGGPRRSWAKADWTGFRAQTEEALADWGHRPPASVSQANQCLTDVIKAADCKFVPCGARPSAKAWWTPEAEAAVSARKAARAAATVNPSARPAWNQACATAKNVICAAKREAWRAFAGEVAADTDEDLESRPLPRRQGVEPAKGRSAPCGL